MAITQEKNGPDVGIVTGFIASKGMDQLQEALKERIYPSSCAIIPSAPLHKAAFHPHDIASAVEEKLSAIDSDNLVLIGHSYGALIALMVACRRRLRGISKLFLIDGPLSSRVEVKPAMALHNLFHRHYTHRVSVARECEAILKSLDHSKIMTICSGSDRIVPPEAKFLSGNFGTVLLSHDHDVRPGSFSSSRGYNVVLPSNYKGHSMNKRVPIVSEIIRCALQKGPSLKP